MFLRTLLLVLVSSTCYAGLDGNIIIQGKVTKAYQDRTFASIQDSFKQQFVVPKRHMKYTDRKQGKVTIDMTPGQFMKYRRYCLKQLKGKNKRLCPPSL